MNIGRYIQLYSEDLRLKNYAKSSIENYCSQVALFLSDHEKVATKPSEISERQIKEWLLKAKTINSTKHRISAIKLFYRLTGKQPLKFKHIELPDEKYHHIVLASRFAYLDGILVDNLSADKIKQMFEEIKQEYVKERKELLRTVEFYVKNGQIFNGMLHITFSENPNTHYLDHYQETIYLTK